MIELSDMKRVTKLLADDSRVDMLSVLMDNRFHTVHELAKLVKVKDQTASYHLTRMFDVGWLESYKQGKYVYYRLVDEQIAELLETLLKISPKIEVNSLNQNIEYTALKSGRTCYHHLAGELGVRFFDALVLTGNIMLENHQIFLFEKGEIYLKKIGLDIEKVKKQSGVFAKPCIDWTERKFHLAGNLGKAVLKNFEENSLIERSLTDRSVKLTKKGKLFFKQFD